MEGGTEMHIAAITPLKLNSSRLPGKNFLDLGQGIPMCWHALNTVRSLKESGDVCDVFAYGEVGIKDNLPTGIEHIEEWATPDVQDGNDLFANMASLLPTCTHILFFNCTSPFVRRETYLNGIDAVRHGPHDSACSCIDIRGRLWNEVQPILHDPCRCMPTQNQKPIHLESEAFWIVSRAAALQHRRVGFAPRWIPVCGAEAIDINTPDDLAFAHIVWKGIQCES